MGRWLKWLGLGLLGLALLGGLVLAWASEPLPEGERGPAADELARRVQRAVDIDAWRATGAVRWSFDGRNQHLWDRTRGLSQVRWDDHTVMLSLRGDRPGCAFEAGERVRDPERERDLVQDAYARWVNDSFWLNPLGKLFDPGVERRVVELASGERALLVTFTESGLTPGDSYLWLLDESFRPRAWRMWVQIIPVGGLQASWEDWRQLSTGAWVSTLHRIWVLSLDMENVAGAATLEGLQGLEGADPFVRCGRLSRR